MRCFRLHMQLQANLPHLHCDGMHLTLRQRPLLRSQQWLQMRKYCSCHFKRNLSVLRPNNEPNRARFLAYSSHDLVKQLAVFH